MRLLLSTTSFFALASLTSSFSALPNAQALSGDQPSWSQMSLYMAATEWGSMTSEELAALPEARRSEFEAAYLAALPGALEDRDAVLASGCDASDSETRRRLHSWSWDCWCWKPNGPASCNTGTEVGLRTDSCRVNFWCNSGWLFSGLCNDGGLSAGCAHNG